MTELTDAPEGGTDAEAIADVSTVVDTNSEATAEQNTGTDDTGQADDTGEAAKPKQVPWFQKRIDEVTAQKYEAAREAAQAAREAAYWRGLAEGRNPHEQPQAQVQQEERPDRWDDPDGHDQWLIEQAKREFQQEQKQQAVLSTFEERAAKFQAEKPDFESVAYNPTLRISPSMERVIRVSEVGPQIAYHLGTNPAEAARIASLETDLQAKELGRLEERLSNPAPAPQQSQKPIPPAPPQTVAGLSAGLSKSAEDMSMAEYIKAREAGQI